MSGDRVERITLDEWNRRLKAQGVPDIADCAFICPMCGTVQSGRDFEVVGVVGREQFERFLAFSCIGRWTGAGSPRKVPDGEPCNWTLGGFLTTHRLVVVTPDGGEHPRFVPAAPEVAQAHADDHAARERLALKAAGRNSR